MIWASGRAREVAIRLSLGAGRWHVVRQVVTETILLTSIGGACGLAVSAAGIRLLTILGANQLPLGAQVTLGGRLAVVGMAAAAITGMLVGSLIAWVNLRGHPASALHSESRTDTASHAAQRLRHSFIIAQVALAFVLLVGGGLLSLSLKHVMAINPGFPPDHVLNCRGDPHHDRVFAPGFLAPGASRRQSRSHGRFAL